MRWGVSFACACLAAGVLGLPGLEAGVRVAAVVGQAPISLDESGSFLVGGRPTFLIGLSNPPPLLGRTPSGVAGPLEIARSGVNLVRVGPAWTGWTRGELRRVLAWEKTAALLGLHMWVRLNTFAATKPRWRGDAHLAAIVQALTRSPFAAGMGLWQGADEPWTRGITAQALAFVYCRLTSRGNPRACAGEPPLDPHHLLATVLAPTGTPAQLAPYSHVADSLGVDVYPVTVRNPRSPHLHEVGLWTRRIAAIAQDHSVETTLQICSMHAYDKYTGAYVLPSAYQERYMVYDAIINGARGVSFFGGNNPHCWNRLDRRYKWNWTFWNRALDPLIEQINARSKLGPALGNAASNHVLHTSDPGTEAISRLAAASNGPQRWVIAARSDPGVGRVTLKGLPTSDTWAAVYGERREIRVSHGTITDTFRQWQVHVYRLQPGARLSRPHRGLPRGWLAFEAFRPR